MGRDCTGCKPGFQMVRAEESNATLVDICVDIDECANEDTNDCHAKSFCVNLPGTYECGKCVKGCGAPPVAPRAPSRLRTDTYPSRCAEQSLRRFPSPRCAAHAAVLASIGSTEWAEVDRYNGTGYGKEDGCVDNNECLSPKTNDCQVRQRPVGTRV